MNRVTRTVAPDERPVLRCTHCQLNQFVPRLGVCRRCRKPLRLAEPEIVPPLPEAPLVVAEPEPAPVPEFSEIVGTLGERIRQRRIALGMSGGELCRVVGITRNRLCDIENGRTLYPQMKTRVGLALALGCTLQELQPQAESEAA